MASDSALTCIYSALILSDSEVTVTALASVNIGSLICNVGAGGPAPASGAAPAGGPAPSTTAAPAEEKKVEAKKEESEESDDDMGFGLFD
ncbi:60S acidic ribosomal protein P1-like isoform X2 [Neophocaena asiaeorientalis asiaeorientalis]|uniref:60S acidic ribosomal protein P1-like isoform X2 n=1 Tax=Neophocaena asiaeorientalis asiaeorientalis TaxID=1706337 RepID=A0A341CPU7_NEOAA|nr:60S acidic ribosomal protein P1-like isoform X2 [Neophocaena asiaeorientalis asiaeorientalis]XP_032472790.1 60S acidic ribosomal protein P1-like isoform X2 [Phocoena sinus]